MWEDDDNGQLMDGPGRYVFFISFITFLLAKYSYHHYSDDAMTWDDGQLMDGPGGRYHYLLLQLQRQLIDMTTAEVSRYQLTGRSTRTRMLMKDRVQLAAILRPIYRHHCDYYCGQLFAHALTLAKSFCLIAPACFFFPAEGSLTSGSSASSSRS